MTINQSGCQYIFISFPFLHKRVNLPQFVHLACISIEYLIMLEALDVLHGFLYQSKSYCHRIRYCLFATIKAWCESCGISEYASHTRLSSRASRTAYSDESSRVVRSKDSVVETREAVTTPIQAWGSPREIGPSVRDSISVSLPATNLPRSEVQLPGRRRQTCPSKWFRS